MARRIWQHCPTCKQLVFKSKAFPGTTIAANQILHSTCTTMNKQATPATPRPLHVIAKEAELSWKLTSKSGIYFGAKPYLDALKTLTTIDQNYGADSAMEMVLYFLANSQTWRGEDAKRIKKELKDIAGIK